MTEQRDDTLLSIGALSKATGIPKETLRTWERRYDFPHPARTDSGHRRYSADVIEPLRLAQAALEQGHRAAQIIGKDADQLRHILNLSEPTPPPAPSQAQLPAEADPIDWMQLLTSLDQDGVAQSLERAWFALGPHRFLTTTLAKLIEEIGQAWHDGKIAVFQEQFASQQIKQFLWHQWSQISAHATGERVVLATLPGEYHTLGLHMAACVMALAGHKPFMLGADAAPSDIAQAAAQAQAKYILLSLSSVANPTSSARHLQALRALLPSNATIIIGGQGASEKLSLESTKYLADLDSLQTWARAAHHPQGSP